MASPTIDLQCHRMTESTLEAFLEHEKQNGASKDTLRQRRGFVTALYAWLPEDKLLTKDRLLAWRESLNEKGFSPDTVGNYVKGANRYLDFMGLSELRFNRGKAKNLQGQTFGYLTAIAPTGAKKRRDLVWRCRCRCGNEIDLAATRLLTGNNLSCGCLRAENLQEINRYIEHTSIRMCLEEKVESTRSSSGYTGVTRKRDKWEAYIKYKGIRYSLGRYSQLEDAVKARAYGKQLVQEDARKLLEFYEELHKDDSARPTRKNSSAPGA